MRISGFILAVVLMITVVGAARTHAAQDSAAFDAPAQFSKAGVSYQGGAYKEAIKEYEAILANGSESGPLYYNIGNSYFKDGQLGRAVLNYERAGQFMPRDGDLKSNYLYARSRIANYASAPARGFWRKTFWNYAGHWTLDEITWILFALAAFTGAVYLAGLYGRWPPARVRVAVALLATALAANGAVFSVKSHQIQTSAVILTQSDARFEPAESATAYFKLPEGEKVTVVKVEGTWAKIRREDDKAGWVPVAALGRL